MNSEFKSLDELYSRVKPALYSKLKEIHKLGFTVVSEIDIWNYLIINSDWKNRINLELHEIISDILYADNYRIYEYVMNNVKKDKLNNEKRINSYESLI